VVEELVVTDVAEVELVELGGVEFGGEGLVLVA
jgi:hypothetical protein